MEQPRFMKSTKRSWMEHHIFLLLSSKLKSNNKMYTHTLIEIASLESDCALRCILNIYLSTNHFLWLVLFAVLLWFLNLYICFPFILRFIFHIYFFFFIVAQFSRISRIGHESQHNRELSCELRVVAYHFHSFIKWIEIAFYGQLQFILSSNASSSIAIQWHRMLEFENIRHSVHFLVAVELNLDTKLISTDYQWPSRKCFIFVDTCLPIEYELDITKSKSIHIIQLKMSNLSWSQMASQSSHSEFILPERSSLLLRRECEWNSFTVSLSPFEICVFLSSSSKQRRINISIHCLVG